MKNITSHLEGTAERAKAAVAKRSANLGAQSQGPRAELRLVPGGANEAAHNTRRSAGTRVEISEKGRELLSQWSREAIDDQSNEGATEDDIVQLIAEGIEEGFLD
jgi:hypothetical protein